MTCPDCVRLLKQVAEAVQGRDKAYSDYDAALISSDKLLSELLATRAALEECKAINLYTHGENMAAHAKFGAENLKLRAALAEKDASLRDLSRYAEEMPQRLAHVGSGNEAFHGKLLDWASAFATRARRALSDHPPAPANPVPASPYRVCHGCGGQGWPTAHDDCEVCHGHQLPTLQFVRCRLTVTCCLSEGHPGYCVATLPIPEGHPLHAQNERDMKFITPAPAPKEGK